MDNIISTVVILGFLGFNHDFHFVQKNKQQINHIYLKTESQPIVNEEKLEWHDFVERDAEGHRPIQKHP